MESFLNRYRNITVLLLVIMAQLVLLAVQVKNDQDVRIIRIWTVTAVTPVARVIEAFRGGGLGFVRNYVLLHDTNAENRRLKDENARLKLENIALKDQLNTADRAKALQVFQQHTASKTLAASVILASAGSSSSVRFLDRGSFSGVERGMAVVTPDGIVGKIIAAYPSASEMMLVTDPDFAAGVVTSSGVRGTLKGQGNPTVCRVDYVPAQEKIAPGDMLYTSGDDRIFPRGFTVGVVKEVRNTQPFKEVFVEPTGVQHGVEDVLILLDTVHQDIPKAAPTSQPVYIAPPPPATGAQTEGQAPATPPTGATEADRLRQQYKTIGEEQKHNFGEGGPGSKPPDFTKLGGQGPAPSPSAPATRPPATGQPSGTAPAGAGRAQPPSAQGPAAGSRGPSTQPPANAPTARPNGAQPALPQTPATGGRGPATPTPGGRVEAPSGTPPTGAGRAQQGSPPSTQPLSPQPPARRANQANGPGGQLPE